MTDRLTHSAELCLINQSDALSKIDKLQKHRVQKVTQFRPFDGQAEEAAQFYVSLVPDSRIDRVMRSPIDTSARDKRRGEKWSRLTLPRWNRRPMGDSYLLNMNSKFSKIFVSKAGFALFGGFLVLMILLGIA